MPLYTGDNKVCILGKLVCGLVNCRSIDSMVCGIYNSNLIKLFFFSVKGHRGNSYNSESIYVNCIILFFDL